MPLTKKTRRTLASQAQLLKPVLIIGKAGLKQGSLQFLSDNFQVNELLKVHFNQFKHCKGQNLQAELVQIIGHVTTLYRQKRKQKTHSNIESFFSSP